MSIRRLTQAILLVAVPLVLPNAGSACDLCSIYFASQAQGQSGSGGLAGLVEQFTHFGTLQNEGEKVPNPAGQFLDSSIVQLLGGYRFSERFGLQLNVPVVYRSFERPAGFATDRGSEAGLGDLALLGSFTPYQKQSEIMTFRSTLLVGLKLPSGSTDRLREELHESEIPGAPASGIHGHDLTLGTGSVDGIVGGSLYGRWKRLFLSASTQYAIRSEGDFEYRFANDLIWSGGPGLYALMGHTSTLGLQGLVSGETKGLDQFRGAPAEDTGITTVYVGPEVTFTWLAKLSAHLAVDFPLIRDNTGLQIVPDYRVRAGLTWHF